jgi:iron complex outermembrane receptor protein
MKLRFMPALLLVAGISAASVSADDGLKPSQLATMGIEQLMNVDISSVSKKDEKLIKAPAAVYVLSNDDIRRSGATSIPEALRLVPGLSVTHVTGNIWAISARGFNGQFANKLLVLIDGRTVYTPLFSGVYWDVQDLPLEDIERIEVIRGPGATLWGANAVNGVINVITKSSSQTKGWLVSAGAGNKERAFGTLQYGGDLPSDGSYRAYVKYFDRDNFRALDGSDGQDGWQVARGGFRSDWQTSSDDSFTVQGDVYNGSEETKNTLLTSFTSPFYSQSPKDTELTGGNVLGRWAHKLSADSDMKLQTYYDRTYRDTSILKETRDTADIDFQHRIRLSESHDFIYGLGFRNTTDDLSSKSLSVLFNDNSRGDNLFSSFLQDDLTLVPDQLHLVVGSKFEHNNYTGAEIQPSVRSYWTINEHNTLWGSVARAVRTPSRGDQGVQFSLGSTTAGTPLPGFIYADGDPGFDSEQLYAYELGYRSELCPHASIDFSTFYNNYAGLRGVEPGSPFVDGPPAHLIVPLIFSNTINGTIYGFEISTTIKPFDFLTWKTNFSFLQTEINPDKSSLDTSAKSDAWATPQNQLSSWLAFNPAKKTEADLIMYYVDSLRTGNVPSYTRFDARIGYDISATLNASAVVQNLFDNNHLEFVDSVGFAASTQVSRSFFGKLTWKF